MLSLNLLHQRVGAIALGATCFVVGCMADSSPPRIPPAPLTASTAESVATQVGQPVEGDDRAFEAGSAAFLAEYLERNPVRATELGEHRYDGRWPVIGPDAEKAERQFIGKTRGWLDKIRVDRLGDRNRVDALILRERLDRWSFALDELRVWESDPVYYTGLLGDGLDPLVTRDFAPLGERMANLGERLAGLPAVVQAAKANLKRPPNLHTRTAMQQNAGLVALVEKELPRHFAKLVDQKVGLEQKAAQAAKALREFGAFLKDDLLKRSDGDVRLGPARFEKKLRFYLEADIPSGDLVRDARELLVKTQEQMVGTAVALWPELFPKTKVPEPKTREDKIRVVRAVLDAIAKDHPTNATIVDEASKLTDSATQFVRDKNMVELPAEPIKIIEMPEYRRGIAVAYCDSAGPLEKNRTTFYSISPTPADWPQRRVDSFYREYNRAMLANLTVHEAMPGHYLQIAHANRFTSNIRAVFESGSFVEGWAVYAEWLMSQHGFGGARTRIEREKMVLRLAANAILDHDIHAGTMDEKAAMKLMTEDAYQEEGEAAGKWRRAQLTSAQLSTYFYGFSEMMKMRRRAEKESGFSERAYHDRLLSFGSPPPKVVRHLLFGDPIVP